MIDWNAPVTLTLDTYDVASIAHACFMQAHEALGRGHTGSARADALRARTLYTAIADASSLDDCAVLLDLISRRMDREQAA